MAINLSDKIANTAVTVKQIQRLDKVAIDQYGVPSIVLMENAGQLVSQVIIKKLKRTKRPLVHVVSGVGNNAGDGFVIARYLINAGIKTKVFHLGKGKDLKADAAINYQLLKKLQYPIEALSSQRLLSFRRDALQCVFTKADIVVDAVFGVGLNREIKGAFKDLIEVMNSKAKRILSVDIPSGLDGTTGKIFGVCIKAQTTVTFSFPKKGFYKNQGPKYCGKIIVVDIGIPKSIYS